MYALLTLSLLGLACTDKDTSTLDDTSSSYDTDTVIDADNDGVPAEEDCDDEDPEVGGKTDFYVDADRDGFGDPDAGLQACTGPSGTVADGTDCNDLEADINPDADEVCDGEDNDCDTFIDDDDDDLFGADTWFHDGDGDGYGDQADQVRACIAPTDYVDDDTDCDDGDGEVNPGEDEICDEGRDNDCNGLADDEDPDVTDPTSWYEDADSDGYGTPSSEILACDQPSGFVDNYGDCDDDDGTRHADCGARDGTYTGSVTVELSALGITDSCTGSIELEVAESSSPQISGSGTCAFTGSLSGLIGTVSTTLTGNIDTDPDCSGDIDIDVGSLPWSGQFTTTSTLEGEAEGSFTYSGTTVDYLGTFSTSL